MRKVLAALTAAAVLVLGAFTAAAVSRPSSAAARSSGTDDSSTTVAPAPGDKPQRGKLVEDVLSGLVDDGTITQDQADAVAEAFAQKFEEMRTDRPDRMGAPFGPHRGLFGLRDMLEDGVIDADELAKLPADSPLRDPDGPAAPYLDDGQITVEELHEIFPFPGRRGWHGQHDGADGGEDSQSVESNYSA
jgi:hypothetical protein